MQRIRNEKPRRAHRRATTEDDLWLAGAIAMVALTAIIVGVLSYGLR